MMSSTSSNAGSPAALVDLFRASASTSWLREAVRDACRCLPRQQWTVLALGKAAVVMANAACELVDCVGGLVVAPADAPAPLPVMVASHPVPDGRSEAAGRALLERARRAPGPVLALVSGGGSALACVPAPGLSLREKVSATSAVMDSGATIHELNAVRKALSGIKGGRLAAACPGPVTTLACSDVVGNELGAIASGPTVPDDTVAGFAARVCRERGVWDELPETVRARLASCNRIDAAALARHPASTAQVIAPLERVALTARALAEQGGMRVQMRGTPLQGDVLDVARELCRDIARTPGGTLGLAYGEATVAVGPDAGVGGRAQQLALLMARELAGQRVVFLCAGTDGIDGRSPAAGAVIDGSSWRQLEAAGHEPQEALDRCAAYPALSAIGATIETGRTGVNHADLVLFYVEPPSGL